MIASPALRLAGALRRFWMVRGYFAKGERWPNRKQGDRLGRATSLHDLARLAHGRDDHPRAITLWGECLRLCFEAGTRPELATCLASLAMVYATTEPSRAVQVLAAAEALRGTCGGSRTHPGGAAFGDGATVRARLEEAAFAAARAAGPASPIEEWSEQGLGTGVSADVGAPARDQEQTVTRQTPSRKPSGYFTRREREAADLMAQGLTNRQIATRLVITERTAETHARHVLGKLGLRSRAQLIPSATERRMLASSTDRQAQSA